MRMKASVPFRRGGWRTISWSKCTPAGEAIARASSAVTTAGLSRISTTMISLPMPFILANAWLASALMEFPDVCLPYMANDGGLASVVNLCRLASLAEKAHDASVMGRKRALHVSMTTVRHALSQREPGHLSEAQPPDTAMENTE